MCSSLEAALTCTAVSLSSERSIAEQHVQQDAPVDQWHSATFSFAHCGAPCPTPSETFLRFLISEGRVRGTGRSVRAKHRSQNRAATSFKRETHGSSARVKNACMPLPGASSLQQRLGPLSLLPSPRSPLLPLSERHAGSGMAQGGVGHAQIPAAPYQTAARHQQRVANLGLAEGFTFRHPLENLSFPTSTGCLDTRSTACGAPTFCTPRIARTEYRSSHQSVPLPRE